MRVKTDVEEKGSTKTCIWIAEGNKVFVRTAVPDWVSNQVQYV
jgi:hypothetical protein